MSRLKSSRGMTFMELLCAVLILMMSTALVLVGVNLALTTYRVNMEASEAQVLYSTLTTVISDKLRYCGTVETAEDGTITQIFAQGIGTGSGEAFQLTEDGKVMLGGKSLLGSGAYPRDLTVSSLTMTYNKDSRLFTVSMEISNQKGQRLAGGMDFQVKKLNTSESDI